MARPRRRSSGTSRRKFLWHQFVGAPASVAAGGTAVANLDNLFNTGQKAGATHIRTVGTLSVWAGDENDITEGKYGMVMVGAEAIGAGTFPEPATDSGISWMTWGSINVGGILGTAIGQFPAFRIELDVKSKRKYARPEDGVHLIIENHDGTFTFQFSLATRTLLMLA